MPILERVYAATVPVVRPLARLASPLDRKLARGVAARRGAAARLEAWAAAARESGRPLVWLHAPSVGEALMAQAIAAALRERSPDVQVAFTFFSPSAERAAGRVGADVCEYLPWDTPGEMARVVAALRPGVIAFVRSEIWPVLTRVAAASGVRLALVNAVLAAGSSRLRAPARAFLAAAYGRLDRVGAVSPEHAARFPRLGVDPRRVVVTGDARFDQVWKRVYGPAGGAVASAAGAGGAVPTDRVEPEPHPLVRRLRDASAFTLVAGSTWPPDEERLVPAFATLLARRPARLIIAPHEPDEHHLGGLERRLEAAGLRHGRLGVVERTDGPLPDVVVVDRVGVLADLYAAGDVAYVGGAFGRAGLHSVVEPAALRRAVVYGPRHGSAREGAELAAAGGGFIVEDATRIQATLLRLATDEPARRAAGSAARTYVQSQLGGARNNAELIAELLGDQEA